MLDAELRVLNQKFEQIAVVRDFSSLQWTEKYYDVGTFALEVGLSYSYLIEHACYLYWPGTEVLGVIDQYKLDTSYTMKGRFCEALLLRVSVNTRVSYTGTAEDVCRALVKDFCVENKDGARNVSGLKLGEQVGFAGEETTIQPYGKTVYDAVRELLTAYEMSFRLRYDFMDNLLYFEVYQGLDRTQSQTENDWCIFSSDFYNVISETFTRTLDTRNFAYVVNGNEDRNEDEWIIEIDLDDGKPRSEVWVQANIRLTEDMTDEEYEAAIRQVGLSKLAQYNIADTGECVIDAGNAMACGLGDKCTYKNSVTGIIFEQRITEIREVVEAREISTTIVIGKDQLTESKKIMRAVK